MFSTKRFEIFTNEVFTEGLVSAGMLDASFTEVGRKVNLSEKRSTTLRRLFDEPFYQCMDFLGPKIQRHKALNGEFTIFFDDDSSYLFGISPSFRKAFFIRVSHAVQSSGSLCNISVASRDISGQSSNLEFNCKMSFE